MKFGNSMIKSAIVGFFAVNIALGAGGAPSGGVTDPSGTISNIPYWDSQYMHLHNRAIAFGSKLLMEAGFDPHEWKALNTFQTCMLTLQPVPIPGSGGSSGMGSTASIDPRSEPTTEPTALPSPVEPFPPCNNWDVMVTTAYQFIECPNGFAYIARSGIGIVVESIDQGQDYAWAEVFSCDSAAALRLERSIGSRNPNRPLDLDNVVKQPRN